MKRNGMCPICYVKKLFSKPETVSNVYSTKKYDNGVALTPPMGWSSWNTFRNRIDENLIYDTAVAMKESGLADAGYTYVNLDDNWHSSLRDANGDLQGDLTTFASGIPALVEKINALGLKVGIYSSNGTNTCEDLPASLYNERRDALTFARWGIEYFKYDFCHNIPIPSYAPIVYGISVAKKGSNKAKFYPCTEASLKGLARLMDSKASPINKIVSGLDQNHGAMTFNNIVVEESGEYVLTVDIVKKGRYKKYLMAYVNDEEFYGIDFPEQKHWNNTARFQVVVKLNAGINKISLFNPIEKRADSSMLQYVNMGKMLKEATKRVAEETGTPEKPIVFSLCEWGVNRPWTWGATAGNLWRTTPDIRPIWPWMTILYERTVPLYKYAGVGSWNDPDMLEVGNGKLTYDENMAHFSVWCMLASPLILGNDLRSMPNNVKEIVTNKNLIAIDQDALGKQAKRIKKGSLDILARPLADGSVAVCFFNKVGGRKSASIDVKELISDEYVSLKYANSYTLINQWTNEEIEITDTITANVAKHGVVVYKVIAK